MPAHPRDGCARFARNDRANSPSDSEPTRRRRAKFLLFSLFTENWRKRGERRAPRISGYRVEKRQRRGPFVCSSITSGRSLAHGRDNALSRGVGAEGAGARGDRERCSCVPRRPSPFSSAIVVNAILLSRNRYVLGSRYSLPGIGRMLTVNHSHPPLIAASSLSLFLSLCFFFSPVLRPSTFRLSPLSPACFVRAAESTIVIVHGKRRINRGCRVIDPRRALIHLRKESSVIGKVTIRWAKGSASFSSRKRWPRMTWRKKIHERGIRDGDRRLAFRHRYGLIGGSR